MKKLLLIACSVLLISAAGYSQTGKNEIGVAFDAGLPLGTFGDGVKTGFGGYVKGLYGVGTMGQVTFTAGYMSFSAKGNTSDESFSEHFIPFLVGYRQNFEGFYVEPQIGYVAIGVKESSGGESSTGSTGGFGYAIGVGYVVSSFDLGVRYQGVSKDGTASLIGLHVGYNFSLGGK